MNVTSKIFRMVLVFTMLIIFAGVVSYLLEKDNMPSALRAFLNSESTEILSRHSRSFAILTFLFLALGVLSFFGLYFFWGPARIFYGLFVISGVIINPYIGSQVEPGWTALWTDAYKILIGIIGCLICTTPISQLFSKQHNYFSTKSDEREQVAH